MCNTNTAKRDADMYLALIDVWRYYDENGDSSPDYQLSEDNLERFATALATAYEKNHTQQDEPHAIILNPATIKEAIDNVKAMHGWAETGWRELMNDGQPTTLTELADWWAEQEANEEPQDRASFEVWLLDHIDDEVIAPPER